MRGSVYVLAPAVTQDDVNVSGRMIFLRDIEVVLHNVSTGADSPPDTTDLYGRYQFPPQPPGTYELRWKAQLGWAAGVHPDQIVIDRTQYPVPVRIRMERDKGMNFRRVSLALGVRQ